MLERTFEGLMENIGTILDAGVDQLNLAEYMVSEQGLASRPEWLREEGALYNYKGFITSPISSRRYTYRVIERANEERWPIAINDCSNEYKYYKLCVQENKATRVFQGRPNYWGNTYKLCAVDRWNDESTS